MSTRWYTAAIYKLCKVGVSEHNETFNFSSHNEEEQIKVKEGLTPKFFKNLNIIDFRTLPLEFNALCRFIF